MIGCQEVSDSIGLTSDPESTVGFSCDQISNSEIGSDQDALLGSKPDNSSEEELVNSPSRSELELPPGLELLPVV